MKKIIPPMFHACIDYSVVLILFAGPSIFISSAGVTAKCVSLLVGILMALVNVFTLYEGGIIRLVSMKLHLLIDKVVGVFLIIAPWLFGFNTQTFLLHVITGAILLSVAVCTVGDIPSEFSPN